MLGECQMQWEYVYEMIGKFQMLGDIQRLAVPFPETVQDARRILET
jgi:hypothetical protein